MSSHRQNQPADRFCLNVCTAGIIMTTLGLMLAACGGPPSDHNEAAPGTVETPPSATPPSIEWTDADLEQTAARIGYGPKPTSILGRNAEGVVVFTPQTERDHVATQFTTLPPFEGERTLELVLDVEQAGGEACAANLQDQSYNLLASLPCRDTGEQKITARAPAGVTSVRVYFQSPKREPLRLPSRVRLAQQ